MACNIKTSVYVYEIKMVTESNIPQGRFLTYYKCDMSEARTFSAFTPLFT